MQLSGPYPYQIVFTPEGITSVKGPVGQKNFSGQASKKVPKLYIISREHKPLYVGKTRQAMSSRLRLGFKSDGSHGYHGYAWRHVESPTPANVDIWLSQEQGNTLVADKEIETLESEFVYLVRHVFDQWPEHQTEIHFHPSNQEHREAAKSILSHYRSP